MDSNTANPSDEIDLLDILVTVAESWKLLVVAPLIAGALTFVLATVVSENEYQSIAILKLDKDSDYPSTLKSADVIDPLLDPYGYLKASKGNIEVARKLIESDISFSTNRGGSSMTVSVLSSSPENAQSLNEKLTKSAIELNNPRGNQKDALNNAIQKHRETYDVAKDSIDRLVNSFSDRGLNEEAARSSLGSFYSVMQSERNRMLELEKELIGKGDEVFLQRPTLPKEPAAKGRTLRALIVALGSGFLLLVFVFIRKVVRNASTNPESAAKLVQIRQAFGLSARSKQG
jgi:hypothetical protein